MTKNSVCAASINFEKKKQEEKLTFDATIHHFQQFVHGNKKITLHEKGHKENGILKVKLPTNDMKTFPLETF